MAAEILEFQVNPQSALKALADINSAITSNEGKFTGANKNIEASFTKVQDVLLKLTDRSYAANERYVQSLERQAAAIGKSSVEKLIQERDKHIAKLGAEEAQINRVRAAYDKLIAAESGEHGNKFQEFGETVKEFIESPLQAGGKAATGFLGTLGPVGIGLGGVAVAAVAVGTAVFEMTERFSESSESLVNLSASSGIALNDLDRLQAMAKLTGTDISTLARAGTMMAQTLDQGGEKGQKLVEALARIHVSTVDFNGAQKDEGVLLVETLGKLSEVTDTTQRLALAAETLGPRTSKSLQPLLLDYEKLKETVEEFGYGQQENIIKKGSEAAEKLHEVGLAVDQVERFVGVGAIAFVTYGVKAVEALAPIKDYLVDIASGLTPVTAALNALLKYDQDRMKAFQESPEYKNTLRLIEAYKQYEKTLEDVSKAQATVSANRFVSANVGTEDALKQDIKDQEKKRNDALAIVNAAKAGSGPGLEAEKKAEQDVRAADARLASDKHSLELLTQQKEIVKAIAKLQTDAALKQENSYYGQLAAQKKLLAISEMPGVTQANIEQARQVLAPELNKELQDLLTKGRALQLEQARKTVAEIDKQQASGFPKEDRQFAFEQDRERKRLEQESAITAKTYSYGQQINQSQAEAQVRLDEINDPNKDARFKAEVRLLAIRKQYADEAYQHELGLAEAQHKYDGQLEDVKTELRMKHAKEVSDLEIELAEKVAEEQRKTFDEVKNESAKLYETLFNHPSQFGKQLQDTLKQAALKPVVDRLSTATATVLTGGNKDHTPIEANNTILQGNNNLTHTNNELLAQLNALLSRGGSSGGGSLNASRLPRSPFSILDLLGGASGGGGSFGGNLGSSIGGFGVGSASLGGTTPSVDSSIKFGDIFTGDTSGFGGATAASGASAGEGLSLPSIATPPFVGGSQGTSSVGGSPQGGGFNLGGLLGGKSGQGGTTGGFGLNNILGNLGGFTRQPGTDESVAYGPGQAGGRGSITGVSGLAGTALVAGGTMLAEHGLMGPDMGTGKGVAEGAIGGAMIGFKFGGPIGAAIGAGVGLGIGFGEMLAGVESPQNKIKRIAKSKYGVTISSAVAANLKQLADQKYAGSIEATMQSPEVRQMLELYAAGTGQKMPLSATTPHAGSLVEQGGQLEQQATYKYGQAFTFQSSLPVAGGIATQNYPNYPGTGAAQPMSLSINVAGKGAGDFLAGSVVTPDFVQAQWSNAQQNSNGRVGNSALYQQPGLITA